MATTIGAVIGFNLLFELLGVTNKSEAYTEVAAQQYSAHFIVGILVFGFISPIAEELLFRGVIYGYLRRFMDIKLAIALSALIFGVYHMNYVQGIYGFSLAASWLTLMSISENSKWQCSFMWHPMSSPTACPTPPSPSPASSVGLYA